MGQTSSQLAFAAVKKWIKMGDLPAGSVVNERDIAEKLGLSRTPVREALGRLEGEGHLVKHGRSVLVSQIRVEEVLEILTLRILLECEAVRLAATRILPQQIKFIRQKLDSLTTAERTAPIKHWGVDDAVHLTIAEVSGNKLLLKTICELRERTRMFDVDRIPSRFDPGRQEHFEIIAALEERNADLAVQRMRLHLENVRQSILNSLAGVDVAVPRPAATVDKAAD
ncbi:DNA-binding GntR family transcriptional regulator [Rhodopseudomonas rhenobacensis]|uniref:DNA-binding GntR family transcriptional regulator n=1 Tax=Rhodopseudomonas rhenobacensis TaxID=87461 RepID=A0A7W7Z8G7_9BRAD|nr:GntR family transcriptional regulator [Rhodopseudomonas rhenobacensis]MBB5049961.1 DNA-binding GntR family transcriptional regulator [Rhodopseudomonas rhenobacensis]